MGAFLIAVADLGGAVLAPTAPVDPRRLAAHAAAAVVVDIDIDIDIDIDP